MHRALLVASLALVGTVVMVAPGAGTVSASTISCTAPTGPLTPATASGGFVGRIPERLADTRGATAIPAECWLRTPLPSSVPSNATAVALTVTSDRTPAPGYLTVHPCGSALPELSNLNIRVEGPNSNFVVIAVDSTREICTYSSNGTHAIVDLVGHFGPGGAAFQELDPRRVLDTRDPFRRPASLESPVAPRQVVTVDRDRLGLPSDASAVMVNLTVTRAAAPGFLTAYPCVGERPPTSNVNYETGVDRANSSVVALSSAGTFCLELDAGAGDIIVDLVGWFGGEDGFDYQAGMSRVADSRSGLGGWSGEPFAPEETRSFDPGHTGTMPDGTRVAVLGVVATRALDPGFLQVRPCGNDADVSSVNYVPNVDIANFVVVPIADDGNICVTSSGRTDVVVDVFGGFAADGLMRSLTVGPHEMFPTSFRPEVHDYVAYCPDDTGNQFTITARGMPRTSVQLLGGSGGSTRLSTSATRDADDAVALRVTAADGAVEEYWVRCLPPDFPKVSVSRTGETEPGWYLLNNGTGTSTGAGANFGIIVDTNGVPVWYKRGLPGREPRGLQRLSDGSLTWFQAAGFAFGIEPSNRFERFELDGSNVREYGVSGGLATNHHELLELPNGHFLVTSMPLEAPVAAQACHRPRTPAEGGGFEAVTADQVAGALIQELDENGNMVREWNADVQGGPAVDRVTLNETTVRLCFRTPGGDDYLSAIHPNALNVRDGLVLMSARHGDAIYAIDFWGSGEVVWKLGGTNRAGVSLTRMGQQPTNIGRQHDIEVLPDGNITLFDNRTPFPFATGPSVSGPARFVEYEIDDAAMTASVLRQVARPNGNHSGALGSARVQPDDGVVINWGSVPGPTFTEFDESGDVLFEVSFANPIDPNQPKFSYRTVKEPLESFDIADLRATAGH